MISVFLIPSIMANKVVAILCCRQMISIGDFALNIISEMTEAISYMFTL